MRAEDVTDTLTLALQASGLDTAKVVHRPRLLSDNGSSYVAGSLAEWLKHQGFDHVRGAPLHPQTQGKIERWHQTLKNRILLEKADPDARGDNGAAYLIFSGASVELSTIDVIVEFGANARH